MRSFKKLIIAKLVKLFCFSVESEILLLWRRQLVHKHASWGLLIMLQFVGYRMFGVCVCVCV